MGNKAVEADKSNREIEFEDEKQNEQQHITIEPTQNPVIDFPFSPNKNEYKWKNQEITTLKAHSNNKPSHK